MTDFRTAPTLGARIKALRKARGIKSTNDLAELTQGTVSAWTLQNLESGRKQDLTISAMLNLAMALKVAPTFLLAPMACPNSRFDMPNLITEFADMSVADFDAWFSGLPHGASPSSGADRNERTELQALRELSLLLKERRRLQTMLDLQRELMPATDEQAGPLFANTERRLADADRNVLELTKFLSDAGWELGDWATADG